MKKANIFISSVQSEFAKERQMLCDYIRTDVLLGQFFIPFIFEETPATEHSPQQVYLNEVANCDIYLGIIGNQYGYEDAEGISPTEREFDKATVEHKFRLIFINSLNEEKRVVKEKQFIAKIEREVVRKTFVDGEGLRTSVYAALVRYLEEKGIIRWRPFDASTDNNATLEALDEEKVHNFILMARRKRKFALSENTSMPVLLKHLFDKMREHEENCGKRGCVQARIRVWAGGKFERQAKEGNRQVKMVGQKVGCRT